MGLRLSRLASHGWLTAAVTLLCACSGPERQPEPAPVPVPTSELPAHCANLLQNTTETDVDCGGPECAPCAVGRGCLRASDCASDLCDDGSCLDRTCANEKKEATETDVDCGGPRCRACAPGQACREARDCTSGVCTREVCAEPSCDDSVQNGAELALDCGASGCAGCRAGTPCSEPEQCASGLCKDGQCDVSCAAGTAECDGDLNVECESQILSDPAQCGACATPCALEHAMPSCLNGACQLESCETSYQDCNGDPRDGCEANLQTNPDHCGGCNAACSRVNADVTCVDTTCALTCNPGYGDCDRDAATGCEKPTSDDIEHCGGCNRRCYAPAGETPVCVDGQCETR